MNTITEDTINENAEIKEVPPLQDLSILFEAYNNHPITPLGRSTFTAMLGSYSMQVVGGIYGFF